MSSSARSSASATPRSKDTRRPVDGRYTAVAFPARLPNVLAVTGMLSSTPRHPEACDGPEVDIAAVITGASALGRTPNYLITWGGTSAATAIVSGTAALVWSKYPWMTRDHVRDRLIWARLSPTGPIDAYKAVGGLHGGPSIAGPLAVEPGTTYSLTAQHTGDGPFTYRWPERCDDPVDHVHRRRSGNGPDDHCGHQGHRRQPRASGNDPGAVHRGRTA